MTKEVFNQADCNLREQENVKDMISNWAKVMAQEPDELTREYSFVIKVREERLFKEWLDLAAQEAIMRSLENRLTQLQKQFDEL